MREKRYTDYTYDMVQRIRRKGYQVTLQFVDETNYNEVTIRGRATAGYGKEFSNLRDALNFINAYER